MNNTVKEFKNIQENNIKILHKLLDFIYEGKIYGIEVDDAYINKLEKNINIVGNERLKVALVGGFSEGKTSIAAAWLGKYDKNSMKISNQESSDEIVIYTANDEIELIDTPGLYGFKEKTNDSNKIEKYKNITRKYISEADLILYVLNSSNPIKESHKEELNWMFRTLNLLPRTIFILSKFDEIVDIEDEKDYLNKLDIKKNNIINRLNDLINLSNNEMAKLAIVAISANPYGEGIEYWLAHQEEFRKLSHIESLQNETENLIKESGGKLSLIEETKRSIAVDILSKQLPVAKELNQVIINGIDKMEQSLAEISVNINNLYMHISQARINLREFIVAYFTDLILQLKGVSLDTFDSFVCREIGENGINIETKLQNEFERQTNRIYGELKQITITFDNELSLFEKNILVYGKQGVNFLKNAGIIDSKNLIICRDMVKQVAKAFNINLKLKFKPWGAIKLANKINIILILLDIGIEIWEGYKQYQKKQQLEQIKNEFINNFNKQKEELLCMINDDKFYETFFPEVIEMEKGIEYLNTMIDKERKRKENFQRWLREGEKIIDVDIVS